MEILIVGCGIAGPVLASLLVLSGQNHRITIVERSPRTRTVGQNVDIRGTGVQVMKKLGVDEAVKARTTGEIGALGVDENNVVHGRFPADTSGRVQTGTSDIEILRGRLAEIMYDRSREISDENERRGGHPIEYIFGEKPSHVDVDGTVQLKSGKRKFDIVVGADGLQSSVRKQVFGDFITPLGRYGTYGGFFSMPAGPTDSQWRRWFHSTGRKSVMVRPSDDKTRTTVFMLFLTENRLVYDDPKDLLASVYKGAGWETERIIREMYAADDFYFDEIAQVKMSKWSKGKVVLLADAGYCASPLSGMGTTLALTGAYNLAGAIIKDPETAFSTYEAAMRPTVQKAQKLAPVMPRLAHPESAWGLWVLRTLQWLMTITNVGYLFAMFAGAPAKVAMADYGIPSYAEWKQSGH